jgi:hypothetical protein
VANDDPTHARKIAIQENSLDHMIKGVNISTSNSITGWIALEEPLGRIEHWRSLFRIVDANSGMQYYELGTKTSDMGSGRVIPNEPSLRILGSKDISQIPVQLYSRVNPLMRYSPY